MRQVKEVAEKVEKGLTERGIKHTAQSVDIVSPEQFSEAMRTYVPMNEDGGMVDIKSPEELADCICLLTEDGKAGIIVTKDGDIEALFSGIRGDHRVEKLLIMAIAAGGVKGDCFYLRNFEKNRLEGLPFLYAKFGMIVDGTTPFNADYAPWYGEWAERHKGEKDVVGVASFYVDQRAIVDPIAFYDGKRLPSLDVPEFLDPENGYGDMLAHRDKTLSGLMGSPNNRYGPEEGYPQSEGERGQIGLRQAAEDAARSLGVEVTFDDGMDALGSYRRSTGQIRINLDAHATEDGVRVTVMHEAVGHKGLEGLLGDRFNDVAIQACKLIDAGTEAWFKRNYKNWSAMSDVDRGAEYMAHIAEGDLRPDRRTAVRVAA